MSSYATEFEHSDGDDDTLEINRCVNENYPLMIYMGGFRCGVEMWREDVARLAMYLTAIVDTVPETPEPRPATAVTYETAGAIRNGFPVWAAHRTVCHNTLTIDGERM